MTVTPTARQRLSSRCMRTLLALCVALMTSALPAPDAHAADPLPFKDRAQEVRFQELTRELRCMVCQNENLADSNAKLASDLRHEIFALMQQGRTDDEIKQYLVARYSEFVLYDPPFRPSTWLLWLGPGVVLLLGAGTVFVTIRRRARAGTPVAPAADEDW